MSLCPKCGGRVFKSENRCYTCGVSFKWIQDHRAAPPPDSMAPPPRVYVFCSRCGAADGEGGIECIDGNSHVYEHYSHKPICNSCGKIAGSRCECVLFHQFRHDFV
jgi:hypothetical protein